MKRIAEGHVSPIAKRHSYRPYSPTSLSKACTDVLEKKFSVYKAAKIYSIPEQTLRDRILGKVNIETTRSGPGPIFSNEEEVRLVDHIKDIARVGYAYTRSEVVNIASEYAVCLKLRTREKPLTVKWFYGFLARWPELKVWRPKTITHLRAKATSQESITNYFTELGRILDKYNLRNRPEAIYNVDEKGIQQDFKPPSVVSDVGCIPSVITSERSSTTTIIGCGNALGQSIPPYFIFAGSRMRQELLDSSTPGANGTVSQSGWSNSEIFETYMKEHFVKYATSRSVEKPILLLYDGHMSHISPNLIDWAINNHIVLYVLPPHTSHILQPMDVGCFAPFSKIYSAECLKFQRSRGASVTRYNVCSIACKAYTVALSTQNLQSAFRRAGIHPFDPNSIDRSLFTISEERRRRVEEQEEGENLNSIADRKSPDADVQSDSTAKCVEFFQKRKPVFIPPFKSQRKSVSRIVAGKAITEQEVSDKIKSYFQQSKSKTSQKPTKSNEKTTVVSTTPMDPCSTVITLPSSQTPGPSGIQNISTCKRTQIVIDSEDSSSAVDDDDDEICCVCKQFQPDAIKNAVSLIFTSWGQCMFEGCDHWVHLKYCCDVSVLRRHDTFYCPCHGLPCKPSILQEN